MAVAFVTQHPAGPTSVNRFVHPGAPTEPRIVDVESIAPNPELRIDIAAGSNIGAALRQAVSAYGPVSGCGRIVGGTLSSLEYHVIIKASSGTKAFIYGPPIVCQGELTAITAAITLGRTIDGVQIIHCHGGFIDPQGRQHGGHVTLDRAIAGVGGLVLRLCLFGDAELVIAQDPETSFDLLSPIQKPREHS